MTTKCHFLVKLSPLRVNFRFVEGQEKIETSIRPSKHWVFGYTAAVLQLDFSCIKPNFGSKVPQGEVCMIISFRGRIKA